MSSGYRILVVGGAGYIGSHVAKALRDSGDQPVVFDNLSSGQRVNLLDGFEFIHGDLLLPEQIRAAMSGIDAIIHLAALKAAGESMVQPERYATHNLSGTLNLLNAATEAGVQHIVFSSSAAVYGEPKYTPMDEAHPTEPVNFYGFTKLEIERILAWYSKLRGLRFASLRYFNAAGYDVDGEIRGLEQDPNNLLPIVLETISGRRPHIEVFGTDYDTPDGSCIRDYIHVSDLADAHVRALRYLNTEAQDLTVNLGTSNGLSVLEIVAAAREISGVDFVVRRTGRRIGDPAVVLASAEQAKQMLGWSPQHSAVQTLLETMVRAYRGKRG